MGLKGGRHREYTLAEKLAARTIKGPSCWECQGYPVHGGYTQIAHGSKAAGTFARIRSHILAWELAHGRTVPAGMVVMHSCDNPRCVNPAHLSLGTQRENIIDSIQKGRYNCFGRQRLNAAKVREIRSLAARGVRQKDIAARFGIARNSVSSIVHGKSWAHVASETVGERPFVSVESAEQISDRVFERVPSVQLPIAGEVA